MFKNWLKERNPSYKKQKEELIRAWDYYDERQHIEAGEIVDNILSEKPATNDILISCLILKSELLNRTGEDFKKSYELASQAVILAEKEKSQLLEANLAKISSLIDQGDDSTIANLVNKVDLMFQKTFQNSTNFTLSARYYKIKGLYYGKIGKIDLSIQNFTKSADLDEKAGKIYDLITSLNNIGLCYSIKDDIQKSLDYLFHAIEIITERNEEEKYSYILAHIYGTVGTLFSMQGELDKSLDYLNKSLEFSISTSNLDNESACMANIGDTLLKKGDYKQAIQYYEQALDLFIQNGNEKFEMSLLVALMSTFILIKNKEKEDFYFDKITTKFNQYPSDPYFLNNYKFSKALRLKESSRLADKVEAQKYFKEISSIEEIYTYLNKDSILYYLELLIEELKLSADVSLFEEIEIASKNLMTLAKKQGSHVLTLEYMIIEAKISILKLDFNKARILLTQAELLAEEKGLKHLSKKISAEHDNLLNKMNQWEDIVNETTSIQERLELSNIEDVLRNMIQKSYSTTDDEQDQGLILLIVNSGGLSMFSKKFMLEHQVEDQIVAGLLTAINSFSQEAFDSEENIERIRIGENTVIIKNVSEFNVCYAFKGPSYQANKKVNLLLSKLKSNQQIIDELLKYRTFLPQKTIQSLNNIVNEIFL